MSTWGFDEVDEVDGSSSFDGMVWDDFGESDQAVPEPDQGATHVIIGDWRKKSHCEFSHPFSKNLGLISQQSDGSTDIIKLCKEEKGQLTDLGSVTSIDPLLQAMPTSLALDTWVDLQTGVDLVNEQASFVKVSLQSEGMTGSEEVKLEPTVSGDLGAYMNDAMYSEEDASIVTTTCHFPLDEVDPADSGLPLFGGESNSGKLDYNWDNSFDNLGDVDKLFRTDSSLGQVMSSSADGLQWPASLSPPSLQSGSHMAGVRSPSGSYCSPVMKGKLDHLNMKMEFIPINTPSTLPSLEKAQDVSFFKDQHFGAGVTGSSLQQPHVLQQSTPDFHERDHLQGGMATAASGSFVEGNICAMTGVETTEDDAGPSSTTISDSGKASMSKAHLAQLHAADCKRSDETYKRQPNRGHGVPFVGPEDPQNLQSMPLRISGKTTHAQPSLSNSLCGYPSTPVPLSTSMQLMLQPLFPYLHAGYAPMQLLPTNASSQMQGQLQQTSQGMYVGYSQPCTITQPVLHQLQPSLDIAASSPTTPLEKLEKLRWRQQMQARFAVEQQQQQFASQPVAMHPPLPQGLPVSQSEPAGGSCELFETTSGTDPEPSLSIGQKSAEAISEEENGTMEAVMLGQLQNIMSRLDVGTRLCIRDALYRLARSAMKRRVTGADALSTSQTSETDNAPNGQESYTRSNHSSSSRVSSVMNLSMVETQTNPIDRSIAHLLFHKRPQQSTMESPFMPLADSTPLSRPYHPPPSGPWMFHLAGFPPGYCVGGAPTNLMGGSAARGVAGVDTASGSLLGVNMQSSPIMYEGPTPVTRPHGIAGNQTVDCQTNSLSLMETESQLSGGHLQQSLVASGSVSPAALGCQPGEGAACSLRASVPQEVAASGPKDSCEELRPRRLQHAGGCEELRKVCKELRPHRLQHAAGCGELRQYLQTEGLDVRLLGPSIDKDDNIPEAGPPHSTSTASDECRQSAFLQVSYQRKMLEGPQVATSCCSKMGL